MGKGDTAIHPRSRKAKQIQRSIHRKEKLSVESKQRKISKYSPEVAKMKWFQDNTVDTVPYDESQATALIQRYIEAKQFELADLKKDAKKNLWKINTLQSLVDKDTKSFEEGRFSAPDVTAKKPLRQLHHWDGRNSDFLSEIRQKNFKKPQAQPAGTENVQIPDEGMNIAQ